MKRFPLRVAAVSTLCLLASATIAVSQEPPADGTTPPAEGSPAPPQGEVAPPADVKATDKPASECKGLEEKPCRKNKVCTWIIPKEANKRGEVPPAYCRKLGSTKAKANNADAPTSPAATPP